MENLDSNTNQPNQDNRKIRQCPYCKQDIKMKVGIHNWKNLFRKPTIEEFITLFIILCVIAIYFVYQHDVNQYRDYINKNCNSGMKTNLNNQIDFDKPLNETLINLNLTNATYINETNTNITV
jgi:hypothetical protein